MRRDPFGGLSRLIPLIAAIASVGSVAFLALAPRSGPLLFPLQDKAEHFLAFAAGSALLMMTVRGPLSRLVLFMGLVALASLIEWVQGELVPGRTGDPADLMVSVLGAGVAILFVNALRR